MKLECWGESISVIIYGLGKEIELSVVTKALTSSWALSLEFMVSLDISGLTLPENAEAIDFIV